jgi:hypothetical protein
MDIRYITMKRKDGDRAEREEERKNNFLEKNFPTD